MKRRLQRKESEYGKITNHIVHRDQSRAEMIHKAQSIFDMNVDCEVKGAAVSSVLTHMRKVEEEWAKFSNDAAAISALTLGKLDFSVLGY